MKFIDLNAQYERIKTNLNERIQKVLDSGQYIMGGEVTELEEKLADYVGAKHCIGVGNGTDALLVALLALDLKAGDEVITPAFSYIAASEMLALLGIMPVLVDIDPATYNLDPAQLDSAITDKTKAIIPVSLYGQCADYDAINAIAAKHHIPVIEDGAQSLGATYKGRSSCNLTTIATTSFFPSKPLGCYGDGGACFTNDDELALRMRQIRVHGQEARYHHVRIGLNARLDTLQAAIVLAKLEVFPEELKLRQEVAVNYEKLLKDRVKTPSISPDNTSAYAQYTIEINNRQKVCEALKAEGIPTAVHYPLTIDDQPGFKDRVKVSAEIPHSKAAAQQVVSLPMHPYLTQADMVKITTSLLAVLEQEATLEK